MYTIYLYEIGLRGHDVADVLVRHRNVFDHLGALTALHVERRANLIVDREAPPGLRTMKRFAPLDPGMIPSCPVCA